MYLKLLTSVYREILSVLRLSLLKIQSLLHEAVGSKEMETCVKGQGVSKCCHYNERKRENRRK